MPKRSTLRLTKRIVDRLKVDDKDAIFWDSDLAGFGVRVHATGRKLYIVQSRGPAGLKRVTLGPVGHTTIEERRRGAAAVIDPRSPIWRLAVCPSVSASSASRQRPRPTRWPSTVTFFLSWGRCR